MSQPFSDLPSHPSLSDNKRTQPSSRRTLFIIIGILIGVSCICIAVAGVVIGSIFFYCF
jgi:flagellar basal body-associated protein FliL